MREKNILFRHLLFLDEAFHQATASPGLWLIGRHGPF
jgi:hypothetical protein